VLQHALVLLQRSLPWLGRQITLGGLRQRHAARRFRRLDLHQERGECSLGVILRPLGFVDALLPGSALGALAGDSECGTERLRQVDALEHAGDDASHKS